MKSKPSQEGLVERAIGHCGSAVEAIVTIDCWFETVDDPGRVIGVLDLREDLVDEVRRSVANANEAHEQGV